MLQPECPDNAKRVRAGAMAMADGFWQFRQRSAVKALQYCATVMWLPISAREAVGRAGWPEMVTEPLGAGFMGPGLMD
jgi:hypothetical protein